MSKINEEPYLICIMKTSRYSEKKPELNYPGRKSQLPT